MLKGLWNSQTGRQGHVTGHLCFNCHDSRTYAENAQNESCGSNNRTTGFCENGEKNMHEKHMGKDNVTCWHCHGRNIHGWPHDYPVFTRQDPAPYSQSLFMIQSDIPNWGPTGNWDKDDCDGSHDTDCG